MKLLRKIALTICIAAMSFVLPSTVFASSDVILTGGMASPGGTVSVNLTPLVPSVIYSVTCPINITGATTASVVTALGIRCPTLGACCKFSKPCLNNLSTVGPKNGGGAYQAQINANGVTTTYTNNSVSQIGTGDTLTFNNLDSAATLIVGNCTATPATSNCCKFSKR